MKRLPLLTVVAIVAVAVAFNHSRAQILAPHTEVDPWAGVNRSGEAPPDSPSGET